MKTLYKLIAFSTLAITSTTGFADDQTFSCSRVTGRADKYQYTMKIENRELMIIQSSLYNRFKPLKYTLADINSGGVLSGDPTFSCESTEVRPDGYKFSINVYDGFVTVKQQSRSARYALLTFRFN